MLTPVGFLSDDTQAILGPVLVTTRAAVAVVALVSYGVVHRDDLGGVPYLAHAAGTLEAFNGTKYYVYPEAEPLFVLPDSASYRANSASVAHTRSLTFLKELLGGPYFDLEAIWEEHTRFEFAERDVDKTMVGPFKAVRYHIRLLVNRPRWSTSRTSTTSQL